MSNTISRQQQKQETRNAIISGAIVVFADLGFDAASFGLIAEQSDCKKALIQYHFETKENLWKESVNTLWARREKALSAFMVGANQQDPAQAMRHLLKQILRFAFDHPQWLNIMFREVASDSPRLQWFIDTHLRTDFEGGLSFVEQAQQLKLLPTVPPLQLIQIISGALFYPVLIAPLTERITGTRPREEQAMDDLVDTLLALLSVK